jgi:predicted nucleic acid-binding protein
MSHVFVETNWLYAYAAPAHHKVSAAVELLEGAKRGEFVLHIPNASFAEALQSIQTKCQPVDGPGIHRYVRWAHKNGELDDKQAEIAHQLADKYLRAITRLSQSEHAKRDKSFRFSSGYSQVFTTKPG